ncbi:MAG: glycosyltransferase [Actinomycetes bacterium]
MAGDESPSMIGELRSRIGSLIPGADERAFNRARDAAVAPLLAEADFPARLADLVVVTGSTPRDSHIVIVPMQGSTFDTWKPAGGNFLYEISQSAREYAGAEKVTVFEMREGESVADWHERLIRFMVESGATHLLAQIESDPFPPTQPNWDVLWSELSARWDGVFLGLMFDSGFRMVTLNARRIAAINDRFVVVDICMPMDGSMRRGRPEVGPVNMPISNESLAALDAEIGQVEQIHDVSFIGALYPYRVEMIETLRAHGVDVAVNPHRKDVTRDFHESRTNQPTYIDYMRGLAQSKMTINFSISSSLNGQQLKTRILEASSMGCLVLTDDIDRSDRFWVPGEEVGYFTEPSEVPDLVDSYLAKPEWLARAQAAGKARARSINVTNFWGGIDEGLRVRGLPALLVSPTD